ncbi:MAG: hypothetical protein ACTSYY_16920 [Promethearchaeota archaeon]
MRSNAFKVFIIACISGADFANRFSVLNSPDDVLMAFTSTLIWNVFGVLPPDVFSAIKTLKRSFIPWGNFPSLSNKVGYFIHWSVPV